MSKKKNASSASAKVAETGVAINYRVNLKCKNAKQKELVKSIHENDIIFAEGVFGVGKTFVINSVALEMLKEPNNGIDKIILIVPTCSCSATMELGHLPGSLDEKLYNFALNEMDSLRKILKKSGNVEPDKIIDSLVKNEKIDVKPISFLRGASIENAFICVSEAEEFTKEDLFLIMSRFESGKMVISGDPLQASRNQVRNGNSGLLHAMEKLTDINGVGTVKFTEDDIVRNDILYDIYKKWNS